ncbi:IQ domain-containing protein N [Marmota monax]|uniref:IQ domain-containing protein N n=1 Tax=Marmota monax TaxID=9995 RepID=UPI0026EFE678|nr:IQ domain-containing protein N [Marmota monax]
MMQPAAQLQFMNQLSPSGQCIPPPQPIHCLPDKVGRASAQQYEARKSKEQLPQQPAQSKMEPRRIPCLRAVVESQAFKNILVDEMDMMLSRAATLIQANWRGYRLRQKLISQMLAAKAIQEAWRRFNTRRLLRFSKVTVKRVSKEEGDIPYHPPQQVRFQPPEDKPLQVQPVMMSKETQFPSSDSLITCIPQLGLLQHPAAQGMAGPGVQAPHGPGAHGVAFLPHQTIAMRLPSPVSLDPKCQPCLLTKTVRSSCLIRHLEGDTVKTKHVTTRATRAGAPEPPPSGRYGQAVPGTFKAQIQAHVEADTHKTPPQAFPASTLSKTPPKRSPLVSIARTQAQVSPISTVTKTPPQTGPGPIMTVMKTLPQTGPSPTVTRTQAQMRQTPSLTNAPLQSRLAATMAKIPPQVCLLASVMRPPCPARPGATTARPPPQTCPVSAVTKPTPQIRLVTAPTKNQMQTCQAATVTKTPSQVCPGAFIMKPPPQTRLAAMIAKTPAPIRSVAAVLRTLCLVPPVVGNLRTPPQKAAGSAGIPRACCTVHLNAQKGKVMVNVRQTAGVKDSSHSFLAEGKVRSVPQPHLEAGAPKPMARGPLEPEKVRTCLQRQVKKETVSKTNMTMEMTQPLPWTKVAEDRNKSPPQAQQRIDLIKVQSQVSVPVEAAAALPRDQMASPLTKTLGQVRPSPRQAKALPQEQLTTPLTKTLTQLHPATEQAKALSQQAHLATCPPTAMPQPHLATCLTKTTSQVHLTSEQTKVLSQGHLSTTLAKTLPQPPRAAPLMTASPLHSPAKQTKAGPQAHLAPQSPKTPSQVYPPSRLTKTPSLAHLVTCLTKAQSQVHLSSGAVKIQSQAQLPIGLTKTQSQAQLVSQTKSFLTARQSTDLNSKTQSQPLLTGSRASAPSCQHLGAMSFLPRPKSEDRPAQLQPQGHVQSKTTHGPCPVASEAQGMLVPLMTSTGQPTCNIEPWGDSGTARAQPPVASQAVPCQEAAASQIASLCAELAAVLGSQEDIRALLAKALSQGEVRAALNQALSKDVLGTTVTKAMPQGMLGMALVKALSWGELGVTLSRALSRGELRSELTKVMQGKLAEVLSKALTDEERAALGQALCQGELGAVLSQSLSQAALRTGAILPKASSKAVGSGMTLLPASVEVDCRGNASAAWGSAVGPGSPQPSKVRVSQVGGWEDFTMGQHAGLLEEMGDGATLEGSPCSTLFPVGMSLTGRMVPSIYHYPMVMGLDLIQPWGRGPAGASYLSPSIKKRSRWLTPGASPATGMEGPHLPKAPRAQPPPSLWQSFIVNGIGPSTSQPSVTCDSTPSSHKPQVVSRVASHSWALSGKGSGAFGRPPGSVGGRRAVHSQPSFPVCQDAACWCQFSGVRRVSPKHSHHRSVIRGQNQLCQAPEEALRRRPQPPGHKPAFHGPRQVVTNMTASSMRTTMVSKVQAPKCPAGGSLYPGPPALMLGRGLRLRGALTRNPPRPREHVASHQMSLLNELVSSLPQHPDNVLTRNFTPGSVVPRQKIPNLYWSPPTVPPLTPVLSRGPVSSHMALSVHWDSEEQKKNRSSPGQSSLDLVERVSQETFRPGLRRSLSLGTVVPVEHQQPSLATKLALNQSQSISASQGAPNLAKSILCQLPVGGRLTRSLSQPTVCIKVPSSRAQPLATIRPASSPPQPRAGGRVFLVIPSTSSSSKVASGGVCTSGTGRETPSKAPPSMASEIVPRSGHLSEASRVSTSLVPIARTDGVVPTQSHPSEISGVTPSPAQPPLASGVSPNLAQPSVAIGVSLNFVQPPVDSGVSPSLAKPSMATGLLPSLVQSSAASGASPNLAQPSLCTETSPSLAQPSKASEVSPRFIQPSMDNRLSPSPTQLPMVSGVFSSFVKTSLTSGVSPSPTQPPMDSRESPGPAQPSLATGVSPCLALPSMASGTSPNLAQQSMTVRVSPNLPHKSMASGMTPSPAQPSIAIGMAQLLEQSSVAHGMSSNLGQPSMASGMSPHPAQPSLTSGVSPGLPHALMSSEVSPPLAQPSMTPSPPHQSVASGVSQSLAQPCMATGLSLTFAQPSMANGVSPRPPHRSTAQGMVLRMSQPPMAIGMSLSLANPSVSHGVSPSIGQPTMVSGMSPSPPHLSLTSGMAPSLDQPVASGVSPSPPQRCTARGVSPRAPQPSMASGLSPTFVQPSMTSGEPPTLEQPSMTSALSPSLPHQPMTSALSPSLSHQPMASGMSQSLAQPSVASGVSPRPSYQSTAYGVAPSLAQPFIDSGVSPSLAQLCMPVGMSPSLVHPSMTNGVSPSLAHPLMAGGLSPILSHRPMATHVAPSPAHLSMASGVPPRFIHPSVASGLHPYLAQPPVANEVSPIFAQPFIAHRAPPSLAQHPMPWGVSQGLAQPAVASEVAPSLAHPVLASGGYPILSRQPMASGVAPSLIQTPPSSPPVSRQTWADHPFLAPGASPLLAQASMAHLGPLSLSQPCMATGLACGLSQPSVIYGVGRGLCEPAPGPRVDPTLQASRVSAGAPGLCPPSVFLSLGSGRSYSCVPGRLGLGLHQPPLDVGVGTCEDPAVADRVVSNLQDAQFSQVSLGLHQPSSVWGRHPTAVSMSAPNLYQTDMTKEVTQGPSMFHSTWLKGMSACSSEGPAAAGMLLSLSQGATPASLAGSIFQKNMVPSMGPSQCQVTDGLVPMASQVLERGVSLTHGETSMATGMDPSRPRVALPSRLGTSQDPLSVFHLGLRTSQATIPLPMPLDHQLPAVPTVVPSSYPYARIVPEDSVMGTASGSLASSSADRRLTPAMVPNAVANFMACSLSRGSVIRGMGQGLPQGSMVTGMAQSRLLDPTASGMARSLPPGTGAGRVAPHQMAASGAKGKRLGLAMGPLARFTAPSLSPGLVAPGVGPSVPLGSVKTGGQGSPQGSMLIGLTPRPYHGAGEGPAALLQAAQAAHAAGLAQVHPQASGAQGTTRAQHRVPTVLSRASPFTQDPRILTLGTIEDPTKLKPRELGGALAQESGSDRESNKSKVLEVTPWMYQSPMDNYVETPRGPPRAEETLPKGQMSLLGERAPGQASGMAPIPFRARHSMTSSFSASLQPDSASPRGPPSTYLITTSRAHSLQLGTAVDRAMPQPLTPVVSDDFSALQPESKTHMRPPSQGSLTSDIVLMSPHLTSPVASSLYAGSVARTESSGVLQRSGSSNVAPHVQPYQSLVKKAVPGHSQMAPVPSTFQKPVSGNLTQTSLKSLRPKKYYRLIHGKLIPELLEGSMTTVVPSNQVQRQETQSPLASRRHSPCELWVGRTPTVQPSDTAYDPSVTRLSPGVRRVSLGYTTSPSGLWRPLLEQDSHESMHLVTRQHKPFPTPSVHQGQISHHAVGPVAGLHKPSLVPTVLQGPVDAGLASGVPSVAVRPMDHAVAPQSTWETARGPVPWDTLGSVAAVSPRQPGELMVSVQTMEKILVRAAVVIQAFARGYLVRSTIRVWHQCATVIQASWRGFRMRRNLARLYRATTIIQAAWRGYCTRRDCAQQMLLPAVWVELGSKVRAAPQPRCFQGSEARLGSGHRCFQSCQPHICSLCQSLSPGLGNPPSVVMLVGSSPRTCHMCGHTLPTRVVHGTGRSISSPGGLLWACSSPKASQGLCRSPGQNRAAMAIQSAWRGFKTRRQLCQQQSAAKMVQSNWRGHYTRSCLTTDMLLGSGAPRDCSRDPSRHSTHSARSTRWPGV